MPKSLNFVPKKHFFAIPSNLLPTKYIYSFYRAIRLVQKTKLL
jgi:hypothetical protein